jgi:hypothetical protein
MTRFAGLATRFFGSDQEPVSIAECTLLKNGLNGLIFICRSVNQGGSSSSIAGGTCGTERNAALLAIFCQESRMVMFGNAATAGVGFLSIREKLTAWHEAIRAIGSSGAQAMGLPADTYGECKVIDVKRISYDHRFYSLSLYRVQRIR